VALAAGFGSLRRFNETFQQMYGRPPSTLRRRTRQIDERGCVTLHLRYRPPYDWNTILDFLRARAIPGMEQVTDESYSRVVQIDGRTGTVTIDHRPAMGSLRARIHFPALQALPAIVRRIRRVFDLDADVTAIGAHLAQDPLLAPLIAARPGLRVPGGWDGFELAIRAILGQQVTIQAARGLATQLIAICGERLADGTGTGDLNRAFPSPEAVLAADLSSLGMPGARRQTLIAMAEAAAADADLFHPKDSIEETVARLCAIRGIGAWSGHYIALRVIRESDAFPASDVGILRGATPPGGMRPTPQALLAMSARWRPWRAYAAQHLWAADPAA